MLQKFKVKNFKKFRDEIVFDLTKTKKYTFNEAVVKNGALNIALIYGSNGSGKTNLGHALFDVIFHTTDNEKLKTFYNNYLYGNGILENKAEFTYEFKFNNKNVTYKYLKENVDKITEEELIVDGKKVLYMNRENKQVFLNIKEATHLQIENFIDSNLPSLLRYVLTNSAFKNTSIYLELKNYLESMLWFRGVETNNFLGYRCGTYSIVDTILELPSIKKQNLEKEKQEELINQNLKKFQKFLNEAGIDLVLESQDIQGTKVLKVVVESDSGAKGYLDFFQTASSGTLSLTNFYGWYKNLDNVKFLFIDEFDSFYHRKLSKLIIKKLKEKKDTQVILTTHSTNLMDNELLRPDAYFILKNNKIKSLPELTDKELREAHNIEKLFNSGAFDE